MEIYTIKHLFIYLELPVIDMLVICGLFYLKEEGKKWCFHEFCSQQELFGRWFLQALVSPAARWSGTSTRAANAKYLQ